ncbi:hypothetical protein OPT61_g8707 [Boeremia exigua]|uniref:Uncharacterized protein n=1 Tax=Boeremia exigua TaxID=749465 RepID=A0ACC2HX57_9PLEO|nr:hypothetical protein OPT61_g8707 [Boeremia exigua]
MHRLLLLVCFGFYFLSLVIAHGADSNCRVRSNATMVPDVAAALVQYAGASEIAAGYKQPWPEVVRNGRKVRVVTYCYTNKVARDRLDCPHVAEGFKRWRDKLDSPPFKGTTNLVWEELNDGNRDRSKRKPVYCFDSNRMWDPTKVPGDTLWIAFDASGNRGGMASVGYDNSRPKNEDMVSHSATLFDQQLTKAVFGMIHEHQRHDRDDYVRYDCKKLDGYSTAIAQVRAEKKLNYEDAHKLLCEDEAFAESFGFSSYEYFKDPAGLIHDEVSSPFDVESLMMYGSDGFAPPQCETDMNACPLLKYGLFGNVPNKKLPMSRIDKPTHPSDGDAKFPCARPSAPSFTELTTLHPLDSSFPSTTSIFSTPFTMQILRFLLPFVALWALANALKCRTRSNSIIVHDAIAEQAQYAGASQLRAQLVEPWPIERIGGVQYRVIKYCFTNERTRDLFDCSRWQPALALWGEKLGGVASAATGHNIGWREAHDGNPDRSKRQPAYCVSNGKWNPNVQPGTLWIRQDHIDPYAAEAAIGYDVLSNKPPRHNMLLGKDVSVDDVVHELGHVFGMDHEMIRSDRDDYLLYQCDKLADYQKILKQAVAKEGLKAEDAAAKLCNDIDFADKYKFDGAEYTKNPHGLIHDDGDFDMDSIMLYDSESFAEKEECVLSDMNQCPLLRYIDSSNKDAGVARIPRPKSPSAGDVEWVKMWYPWLGAAPAPAPAPV